MDSPYRINVEGIKKAELLVVTITHKEIPSFKEIYEFDGNDLQEKESIHFKWDGKMVVWLGGIKPINKSISRKSIRSCMSTFTALLAIIFILSFGGCSKSSATPINEAMNDLQKYNIKGDVSEVQIATYEPINSANGIIAGEQQKYGENSLIKFNEQGYKYIVYIYADVESRRLVASAKLNKFLDNTPVEYEYNEEVDLLVTQKTDLGWKVIVNSRHSGMIYDNEIFVPIQKGDRIKGYVKHIRLDEKLDITLQKTGYDVEAMDTLAKEIFEKLKASGGIIPLSDKSSAEEIAEIFGCSKKSYKKAIGSLYKAKLINITPKTIELI